MKRAGGTLLLVLAGIVSLSGCSDGRGEAVPFPEIDANRTQTPTQRETEADVAVDTSGPPMPQRARDIDADGAEAFARYWFELLEYAYGSGDSASLLAISQSHEGCEICSQTIADIETRTERGERFEGVSFRVITSAASPVDERGSVITMLVDETRSQVRAADGRIVHVTPAAPSTALDLFAAVTPDGWRVFGVGAAE